MLTTLIYNNPSLTHHADDIARVRAALVAHGFDAAARDVAEAIHHWSRDRYNAAWMPMTAMNDAELFAAIRPYLIEETK